MTILRLSIHRPVTSFPTGTLAFGPTEAQGFNVRSFLCIFLLPLFAFAASPTWEKIEGCTLVADGYRDGDSFTVRIAPRTFRVFRLYFVDAPEDSNDQRYPERLADQAKYFGISTERAAELGDQAAKFAEEQLSKPFVVWTCWQVAPGQSKRQRFYAMIETADGRWLSSLLVSEGLARIYGKRVSLPCGTTSREYLALLQALENAAKRERAGGWAR